MPWKKPSVVEERERFVVAVRKQALKFAQVCHAFGISRKTGYKWLARHHQEGCRGLSDHSRRRRPVPSPQVIRWRQRTIELRLAHPCWGAKKIRSRLGVLSSGERLPGVRTLERWLKAQGLLRTPKRRHQRGPTVHHPGLTVPSRVHQVWTVDFKGWYRTKDGQRQEPLTVRDLACRYVLAIQLLAEQSDVAVRTTFKRIFRYHGLPEAIRVDNGAPFGSKGPLGLTRLSVWWQRLRIRVEYTRPARPGDNAGHEQMHGLYAREVAQTPAANRASEQRRADRWRREFNQQRPHEALGQATPQQHYQKSARVYHAKLPPLAYPTHWNVRRVRTHGDIKWQGRLRFIGRAFVGERVGLQSLSEAHWAVYLDDLLIGELHSADLHGMRFAVWDRLAPPKAEVSPHPCQAKCHPCDDAKCHPCDDAVPPRVRASVPPPQTSGRVPGVRPERPARAPAAARGARALPGTSFAGASGYDPGRTLASLD